MSPVNAAEFYVDVAESRLRANHPDIDSDRDGHLSTRLQLHRSASPAKPRTKLTKTSIILVRNRIANVGAVIPGSNDERNAFAQRSPRGKDSGLCRTSIQRWGASSLSSMERPRP